MPVGTKKERNSPAITNQDFSTAHQTAVIVHDYVCPPPPIHPFFLVQNLQYLQNELRQLITCGQSCMMSGATVKAGTQERRTECGTEVRLRNYVEMMQEVTINEQLL